MKTPYLFDEFFASRTESVSPFLTPKSRKWGENLPLKSAAASAFFLLLAFSFSFTLLPASYFCLSLVFFLSGTPALLASIEDLRNLEINIDVLMTVAAFLAVTIGSGLEGALLLVLFELSHGMEDTVTKKAKSALHNLNNIAPKFAHMIGDDGVLFEKSVREITVGEKLFIKQGEIVPLDGLVLDGVSSVNLVHLTGESIPVLKKAGDQIPAGARNLDAALTIEVKRTSSDSTLTKIIKLIESASEAKPKVQRWLDKFGKHYATTIITLTFLFALTLPFLFAMSYEDSLYRSLAFLIAASPCALIIATPTAYLSTISACAKKGVILKGGITIDALASCKTAAFDKTGTLTTGQLECISQDIPSDALAIAYALERHVVHPIASAICNMAVKRNIEPAIISDFLAIPGSGMQGFSNGVEVKIGRPAFVGASYKEEENVLAALKIGPKTYLFRFADQIRTDAKKLIETLPLKSIMLTGDKEKNARAVSSALGIEETYANLRPEDKLAKVALLSQTEGLAMIGDGINDAPALARATVGISMGKIGSATAVDASDVVLLHDDLLTLPWLFEKASMTQKIVRQNLTLALAVICLASLPALLGLVPLWTAVLLHEGGTVLVGLNSIRLLRG